MKRCLALLILCGCTAPEPFIAPEARVPGPAPVVETRTVRELDLAQALEWAERSHPDIAVVRARVLAAEGRSLQAGAWHNPEAVIRREGAGSDETVLLAGVGQRIALGGRLDAARRVEDREIERIGLEVAALRLEIRLRVQGDFAAALHLSEAVRVHDEAIANADQGVAAAKARLAGGDGLPEDVARVELEAFRAKLERDRVRALEARARIVLAGTIGDASLKVESVRGSLDAALEIPALEDLVARLDGHPLLAATKADLETQRARIQLAEAQRIPDLNVELLYRSQSGKDGFDAGIGITLPLFDSNRGRIREAEADASAAGSRGGSVRNTLRLRLGEAHTDLAWALSMARRIREEILPRSETVVRGAEVRYSSGDSSLSDVLPLRKEHFAVRLSYLDALREVAEAWARLSPFLIR